MKHLLLGVALSTLAVVVPAQAQPVPREGPISGRIVSKKQGETAVLVPSNQQRSAEVRQDLKAGDVLRTNALGTLAIVFADQTQLRLGRNSTMLVKEVRRGVPSSVALQRGSVWARSPRGASRLSVETPSATAAIRGTEYSIVATEEQTTLSVVEGEVEFFNDQGRIQVGEGQSAAARLGQAPTRIFTVNPASREQMLYYVSLDSALSYVRPAPLPQAAARAAVERVKAIPAAQRSAEDWLVLAESGAEVEPTATVLEALAQARRQPLAPGQEARARLVEASFAMRSRDYARALALFEQASPQLAGRQREVARFGTFVARTLAAPDTAEDDLPPLNPNEAVSYASRAFLLAYLGDFEQARATAREGLQKFPEESSLYTILAGIGLLVGDVEAMETAARQALQADPLDPFAIRVQTELELNYRGNPPAAIAAAQRGIAAAPGDDEMWNVLAESLHAWERTRAAEQAFQAGLAQQPDSFILHANYALFLLQNDRLEESEEQLAIARGIDPENAFVHLIEGFLALKQGRSDEALARGLDASVANPSYSEALLLLAELYHAQGDEELAQQQVDAADRADPNNPFVALYRAALAIDSYRADDAIVAAREALRRYRARGGVYASLSESKGTGSYIAGAFRFLNLDEWARYYSDRTYDPFVPAALFDRALTGVADPYVFRQDHLPFDAEKAGTSTALSDVFQGLRLDPLAIAGSERELQLTRQEFVELVVTPSLLAHGDELTFSQAANLSAVLLDPVPVAVNIFASRNRLELPFGINDDQRATSVQAFVGLKASPYDNILVNVGYSRQRTGLTGTVNLPRDNGSVWDRTAAGYGLYAHQFDREHVFTIGGGLIETRRELQRGDDIPLPDFETVFSSDYREASKAEGQFAFVNHAIGLGPVEVHTGGEILSAEVRNTLRWAFELQGLLADVQEGEQTADIDQYRAYADLRLTGIDDLIVQGQLALSGTTIAGQSDTHFDFSLGAALEPFTGHWLRTAYIRRTAVETPFTMAPTAVVGLRQAEAPLASGAQGDSLVARWEAEWTPHFFTAVEVQRQDFDGLSFEKPNFVDALTPLDLFSPEPPLSFRSTAIADSRLNRVNTSASLWLTGNIGLRAVYTYIDSEVESGAGAGGQIPFAPKHFARGQVTWAGGDRVKVVAGLSYLGPRTVDLAGTRADRAWLGDLQVQWEPFEKRVQLQAGVFNIFDDEVLLIPGVPNFGRTAALSIDFRF